MGSKKSGTKLAATVGQARSQAAELQDRLGPAVEDARERLVPMVEDARDRLAPVVEDARERLAPVVEDAKGRLADLAESVATKLDESLPDKATPAAVKKASRHQRGGRLRKLLVLAGIGGAAAVVAKKLSGGRSTPQWQSTAPSRPTPVPDRTAPDSGPVTAAPDSSAPTASGAADQAAKKSAAKKPSPTSAKAAGQDAAGGTPGEAASDATETPHAPTTPDSPAETVVKND